MEEGERDGEREIQFLWLQCSVLEIYPKLIKYFLEKRFLFVVDVAFVSQIILMCCLPTFGTLW